MCPKSLYHCQNRPKIPPEYVIKVMLNHEQIGKNRERITENKPFVNKCKWNVNVNFPSKKLIGKYLRKIM